MREAVRDHFGVDDDLKAIEIAGRTRLGDRPASPAEIRAGRDPGESHRVSGHLPEPSSPRLLPRTVGRVLPGIVRLVEALHARPEIILGLLTGNLRRGAELKLTQYGLWHFL